MEQKTLVDLGMAHETTMMVDSMLPVHIRDTVTLDHDIDGALLAQAWERTKRVYPIIDAQAGYDRDLSTYREAGGFRTFPHDHAYLVEAEGGESVPLESEVPVAPGSAAAGGRLLCLSYCGRSITLSCYHAVVDGGGTLKILSTLVYCYLALYTGHEDEHPVVELREGRGVEEYYTTLNRAFAFAQPYEPSPLYTVPYDTLGFRDADMVRGGTSSVPVAHSGSMDVSASDFMRLCKSSGANPSAMLCALLARVTFDLNPEEATDVVFEVTLSMRDAFGIGDSIANAVGTALAYATRSDLESSSLAEVARRIRADVTSQRGADYYVSYQRVFSMYDRKKLFESRTVTYRGVFDIGENNVHVTDFFCETAGIESVYLTQLNDRFVLTVQHGLATDKYLHGFARLFDELGIQATITHPTYEVAAESNVPVRPNNLEERS